MMWTAGSPTQPCGGVKRNAVRFSGHLVRVLEFSVEVFSEKNFGTRRAIQLTMSEHSGSFDVAAWSHFSFRVRFRARRY